MRYTWFVLFPLSFIMAACNFRFEPFVRRDAAATQYAIDMGTVEAIYGTRPPTQPFGPIVDEWESQWCGLVSCETGTPTPPLPPMTMVGGTPGTPVPAFGQVTINGLGRDWVWYYLSAQLREEEKLGVLGQGTTWAVIGQTEGAIQFERRGWVPQSDMSVVGREVQVRSCEELEHPWDHLGNAQLCHTHIWGDDVLAQVPPDTRGRLDSESPTNRRYRDTRTGEWIFGPGWEVVFPPAWIPAVNGER